MKNYIIGFIIIGLFSHGFFAQLRIFSLQENIIKLENDVDKLAKAGMLVAEEDIRNWQSAEFYKRECEFLAEELVKLKSKIFKDNNSI